MMAIEKLIDIVGRANVSDDGATLSSYSEDLSFVNTTRPACVVRPQNAAQVKQLVAAANDAGTPLVLVSSGPPHFRGDTVEPGVTFGELIPAAEKQGIRLNLPLAPRASKSAVGSLLDREPVVMPKHQ